MEHSMTLRVYILTIVISLNCGLASADIFDDAKALTNTATNFVKDISGDWCSGQKYLSDMKLSERLEAGSNDLKKEISKLNDTASKIDFDIKQSIEQEIDNTIKNAKEISRMNNELCVNAKAANYKDTIYNGTTLIDKNEVMAQVRLNIATIRSSNIVLSFLNNQKMDFNQLRNRITEKANELEVLRKNFNNLSDPRSKNKNDSYVESVIGNACTAIIKGESLIMEYNNKNFSELFRNAAQDNQSKVVQEIEILSFLDECVNADTVNQQSLLEKAKSLFGF